MSLKLVSTSNLDNPRTPLRIPMPEGKPSTLRRLITGIPTVETTEEIVKELVQVLKQNSRISTPNHRVSEKSIRGLLGFHNSLQLELSDAITHPLAVGFKSMFLKNKKEMDRFVLDSQSISWFYPFVSLQTPINSSLPS